MQLNQVKALITGGVSGLGLAVARKVVAGGGQAVLLDINDEAGAAVEAELGGAVTYVRTDVASEEGVLEAVKLAVDHMGLVNAAVNCAGIIGAGRVLGREAPMALEFFSKVIQVNLVGKDAAVRFGTVGLDQPAHGLAEKDASRNTLIVDIAELCVPIRLDGYAPYREGGIGHRVYEGPNGDVTAEVIALHLGCHDSRSVFVAPRLEIVPNIDIGEVENLEVGRTLVLESRNGVSVDDHAEDRD